jgi:hypothetical protein
LRHDGDALPQIVQAELADVLAVDPDAAFGDVVIAQQQLEQAGLAGAGRADQGDALAGGDVQADVVQGVGLRTRRIAEADVLEADGAPAPAGLAFGLGGLPMADSACSSSSSRSVAPAARMMSPQTSAMVPTPPATSAA